MNALRTASTHPVAAITFAPDGAAFAATQPHHGVTVHDRTTGQPLGTFGNPRAAGYTSVVFCRDGQWLAVSTPKGLDVYDVATAGCVWSGHSYYTKNLRLAALGDGLLAAGGSGMFEVRFPPADVEWKSLWGSSSLCVVGLSPDGRSAISLRKTSGPVVYAVPTGAAVATLDHPVRLPHDWYAPKPAFQVAFAASGTRLAVLDGRSVAVYALDPPDEPDGPDDPNGTPLVQRETAPRPRPVLQPVFRLDPPERWPAAAPWLPPVALTPDGRGLLVRRPRNRVQLWDVGSGCRVNEWSWQAEVTCLAVAPDGLTAAAGGRFGRVVGWDLE